MELLSKRRNGGYFVKNWSDGTKERFRVSNDPPEYPETVDLKITNACDLRHICTYCHEGSKRKGDEAELSQIKSIVSEFPEGTEFAIGGGNPLDYSKLHRLLRWLKENGYIANVTVNQKHVERENNLEDLVYYQDNSLIKGVGISYRSYSISPHIYKKLNNIVVHIIAGVEVPHTIASVADIAPKNPNFLVLGYKTAGGGENYLLNNSGKITDKQQKWRNWLDENIGEYKISFDNLAIKQLNIKDKVSDEVWDQMYMGEEGQFSMYIDTVENEYNVSSFSGDNFSLSSVINVKEAFEKVRSLS